MFKLMSQRKPVQVIIWSLFTVALSAQLSVAAAQTVDRSDLVRVQQLLAKKDFQAAEEALTPLQASSPNDVYVLFDLAQVYENTNRIPLATETYQKLSQLLQSSQEKYSVAVHYPSQTYVTDLRVILNKKLASNPPPSVAVASTSEALALNARSEESALLALKNWTQSWADKDIETFVACYTPDFIQKNPAIKSWGGTHPTNTTKTNAIQIDVEDVQTKVISNNTVQVQFKQTFSTNGGEMRETTTRTLTFVERNHQWLIDEESPK